MAETGILAGCSRCGLAVDSSLLADGVCLDCRAAAITEADRQECVRLWRKRLRYSARNISTASLDRSLKRLEMRMYRKASALLLPQQAVEHVVETVGSAQAEADIYRRGIVAASLR